jgi:hypothetical protein
VIGRSVLVAGVLGLAASCSSPEPAPAAGGDVCEVTRSAASHMLTSIADDNGTCSVDADCVVVPIAGSCFDSCTMATNLTGKGAVDRALTPIEAGPCRTFSNAGCTKVTPPCAPPSPPVCKEGRCQ